MPLLSRRLLVLLALAAVAAPVLALVLWGRVRGPGPVRVASRLGLVGLAQLTAVLLACVAVNDYGYFYASWSDLLGTGPQQVAVTTTHVGAAPVAASPSAAGTPGQGRLQTMELRGATTGLSQQSMVYLPPQYLAGRRDLPVVEVLTGFPGTELNLVRRLHYPELLLRGIRSGTVPPMVLVLLRPTLVPPRDTECTDVPHGPQALSWFTRDVPLAMQRSFGLTTTSYGVIGDSTGGLCAVKMALLHPERFRAAAALSGYYRAVQDRTTGDLYGGSRSVRLHNDPMWRLQHLPAPRTSLFIATSKQERGPDGYASAQALLRAVRAPLSADELVQATGGHNFTTWSREIPAALVWLGQHLDAGR